MGADSTATPRTDGHSANRVGSVTAQLARYIVDARLQDFPSEVIRKAALCLLDSIGCSMAGSHTRRGDILYSLLTPVAEGGVQIFGRQFRTTPYEAVFYNALTANFLELDDSYDRPGSIMFAHPGANVVPPVLALAQMRGASGQEVLEAIVVGYETCLRVGAAIQPSYRRATEEVWGCATFQTFGSVAAAAKLLKLDLEQTLDALGIAGATAPVPSTLKVWRDDHPDMHNGYGWAAEAGLRAALIAERGYTANVRFRPVRLRPVYRGPWKTFRHSRRRLQAVARLPLDASRHGCGQGPYGKTGATAKDVGRHRTRPQGHRPDFCAGNTVSLCQLQARDAAGGTVQHAFLRRCGIAPCLARRVAVPIGRNVRSALAGADGED